MGVRPTSPLPPLNGMGKSRVCQILPQGWRAGRKGGVRPSSFETIHNNNVMMTGRSEHGINDRNIDRSARDVWQ
jgi:hypothetical protein